MPRPPPSSRYLWSDPEDDHAVAVLHHGDTPDKISDLRMPGQPRLNNKLSTRPIHISYGFAWMGAGVGGHVPAAQPLHGDTPAGQESAVVITRPTGRLTRRYSSDVQGSVLHMIILH